MVQHNRISTFAAIALLACCGLATAQDRPADPGQRARPERPERPALQGPRVREQRVPGLEGGFSDEAPEGAMARQVLPPEVFRRTLGSMMAQDAPIEIRLSAEQRERIAGHMRAFERAFGAQRPARGPGQSGAGQSAGEGADRARGPRPNRPMDAPQRPRGDADSDRPDARPGRPDQRRQAPEQRGQGQPARGAMAAAVGDLQKRVWAELSAAQQAHMTKAIHAWRAQADTQQMDQMHERYRREIGNRFGEMEGRGRAGQGGEQGEGRPGRGEGARGEGGPADLRRWFSQLPEDVRERVRARLESMPAERREALVARAIEMTDDQRAQMVRRLLQSEGGRGEPGRRPE